MRNKVETILIDGPSGLLEVRYLPSKVGVSPKGLAVVAHPHSQHGGSMDNKVVTTVGRAFNLAGWQTVTFNFRCVGKSEGEYDAGRGEADDLAAVVTWARGYFGDLPLALAGFSFGSYVTLKMAEKLDAVRVITIAPPVNIYNFNELSLAADIDWSIIQGGEDEVVPPNQVFIWMRGLEIRPDVYWREKATHFFHGELVWLRKLVQLLAD